jgi:glycosyltransferase involved in cell wall biosynthesis
MYRGHALGVVVPAYNEQNHVAGVVRTLPSYVDRVYVVDDGSTDDTWDEMRRIADRINEAGDEDGTHVVTVRHQINKGVGAAIKTGYSRAVADDLDLVTVMGGDGQMDPEKIPLLLDPLVEDRADYAKGNRLLRPADRESMPRFRLFGNLVLTLLTKIASGYWSVGDPQNGYTAITTEALAAIPLTDIYEYYGYCNDLLVKLNVHGQRVADVRIPAEYGEETSHISYREYVPRVSLMLLRNFLWRLRVQLTDGPGRSVALAYLLGIVSLFVGLASAALDSDDSQSSEPMVLAAVAVATGLGLDYDRDTAETVRIDPGRAETE